jgi:hypothetical protein
LLLSRDRARPTLQSDRLPERKDRTAKRQASIRAKDQPVTASKPNILIIMVDQLNGKLFPDGPADWLHAPHLKALAARSARFRNNYTASPLCAPGPRLLHGRAIAEPHAGL